ncbi:phosphatase 2C-like domain-containing protein [Mycena filopes]|nr:phosphatase 2C-like domain-containing protein [Mycena filopes]
MVFQSARYFGRWTRHPPLVAARITFGISASILLNKIHGDSEGSIPPPYAGFTADKSMWQKPIRFLGDLPPGILRTDAYMRFDTRLRTVSRGSRTLITFFDGEYVVRSDICDIVSESLWYNVESLFRRYSTVPIGPQPVEHIHDPYPSPDTVHSVIKGSIRDTDESVLKSFLARVFSSSSKKYAAHGIAPAAPSCMLAAFYDDDARLLHIGSLGNMRAFLGRPREPDTEGLVIYDLHLLSVDHTPSNPTEKARIEAEHPGEDVIQDGALLGRRYTRALGDGKVKWVAEVQQKLHTEYIGAPPDPRVRTPPYISAEPDVTSIKVQPGDFLIMTSHWVADCLTDREVVGLVGAWVNKNRDTHLAGVVPPPEVGPPAVIERDELPVDFKGEEDKTVMYRRWNVPKRFINVEDTPTMHVASNALGGADTALRQTLLSLPTPAASEGNIQAMGIAIVFFQ